MKTAIYLLGIVAAFLSVATPASAQRPVPAACPRPAVGSEVPEPKDLRSQNGVLKVDLKFLSSVDPQGRTRYCYVYANGVEAPNLRLNPGDVLIFSLKNGLESYLKNGVTKEARTSQQDPSHKQMQMEMNMDDSCTDGPMTASSTNVHFHGLMIPPVCHQDEVLHTAIAPSDAPYEYHFQIPRDQPPGLYWYHPHLHGFSKAQVLGGASGALIVEGIERMNPQLAGLPERVFIIRDQELQNPDAEATTPDSAPRAVVLRDAEGDILNTGTDGGKPAKDLSLNFVPVNYPDYQPAIIRMKPSERQLWRVLNASGITYADVEVRFDGTPQPLGVVALDGVPIDDNGVGGRGILWKRHILLPPAGRAEFVVTGPAPRIHASFVTRGVDTGPEGENDPTRTLATIVAAPAAMEPHSRLEAVPVPATLPRPIALRDAAPARVRKLFLSEKLQNPADPNSPTTFFITEDGKEPTAFNSSSSIPNITVKQGEVEDWIIENRSRELHAFHIHQIHFMLMEWNGVPIDEPFLRDTINVPYWDGKSPSYPSVKLRMDFRNPNIVGTFVYHCHLLEHEDGGMMGTIRVIPNLNTEDTKSTENTAKK
jgi:FtsP/CotA-like multicopper oxidase with cupredoxin domain